MFVKPSDVVSIQFTTQNATTGAAANADSLPTGVLVKNGDDTAETVTVSNIATGVYKASVTIPSGYVAGDEVQLRIAATVSSVAGKAVIWAGEVDTARGSELTAAVWAYATRTLTQSAASAAATIEGTTLTVYRGTTWTIALTGLGSLTTNSKLWFTVKERLTDTDSAALIQVEKTNGLTRVNGAAYNTAADGSITINDASAGNITITVKPAATLALAIMDNLNYDVKVLTNGGVVSLLADGTHKFNVRGDATRAVS